MHEKENGSNFLILIKQIRDVYIFITLFVSHPFSQPPQPIHHLVCSLQRLQCTIICIFIQEIKAFFLQGNSKAYI